MPFREPAMFFTSKVVALSSVVAAAGSALLLQAIEAAEGAHVPLAWTIGAALFGAGATWGATKNAIRDARAAANRAHHRITEEKADRIQAINDLRDTMNTGFTEVNENVRAVLRAVTGDKS